MSGPASFRLPANSFRLPAEWEPQGGVLLAWPHEGTDWSPYLAEVERTYVALVAAIARFETAIVCVADAALEIRAHRLLEAAGAFADQTRAERIRFVRAEYDDTWLRDSGPITLTDGERCRMLDFRFTGWGGKFEASRDDALVSQLVAQGLFAAERRRIDWALEGGGIESDGASTILTTYRCLKQRHPWMSRGEMAEALSRHLEAARVHILEYGYLEGDDTDAHIDTLARFAAPDHIVFQSCPDESDPHFEELGRMREELAALRRPDGSHYRLTALPWPLPIYADDGRRLAASYANFLIVDGAVLMPAYGDVADSAAAEALSHAFPGREIVPVPCRSLIEENGSLHCVTMQLPRGALAPELAEA
jgi:agmatine/peptidylarginine deiminase